MKLLIRIILLLFIRMVQVKQLKDMVIYLAGMAEFMFPAAQVHLLTIHESPLFGLLKDNPAAQEKKGGLTVPKLIRGCEQGIR